MAKVKAPENRPLKRARARVPHPVTLNIDIACRREAEELAALAGIPLSRFIERLIRDEVRRNANAA